MEHAWWSRYATNKGTRGPWTLDLEQEVHESFAGQFPLLWRVSPPHQPQFFSFSDVSPDATWWLRCLRCLPLLLCGYRVGSRELEYAAFILDSSSAQRRQLKTLHKWFAIPLLRQAHRMIPTKPAVTGTPLSCSCARVQNLNLFRSTSNLFLVAGHFETSLRDIRQTI